MDPISWWQCRVDVGEGGNVKPEIFYKSLALLRIVQVIHNLNRKSSFYYAVMCELEEFPHWGSVDCHATVKITYIKLDWSVISIFCLTFHILLVTNIFYYNEHI
jgi:hypothetical protein